MRGAVLGDHRLHGNIDEGGVGEPGLGSDMGGGARASELAAHGRSRGGSPTPHARCGLSTARGTLVRTRRGATLISESVSLNFAQS
jgi:hypothetical protein